MVVVVYACVVVSEQFMDQGYRVSHACLLSSIIRMIDPAPQVIECILNFVGIPYWEEVVVSVEVRAKGAKEGLQFAWTSTVAFGVRDLELVF